MNGRMRTRTITSDNDVQFGWRRCHQTQANPSTHLSDISAHI